jgi:hypothetical protein
MFGKLQKHHRGLPFPSDDTVKAEVQNWLREQNVSFQPQGLENVIVLYDECLNKFGDQVKK